MKGVLFWLASLTWGGIMTFIGLAASAVLLIAGYKPQRFGYSFYFEVGHGWGGVNLGAVFIVNEGASSQTKCHEYGHGWQNITWGVLFPFVIAIPSACRYWYREWLQRNRPNIHLRPYDAVWFEGQATRWGTNKYYNW